MSIINVMNINKINEVCFQCKSPLICKIKLEDVQIFFYKKIRKNLSKKVPALYSCFFSIYNCNYCHSVKFFVFIYAFPLMNA